MALLMRLLLLCVWCSMASYRVITAGAHNLTITKASPMGDVVEGDTVVLRCDAYNLQSTHYIEWTRMVMSSYLPLATNGTRTSLYPRITLNITQSSSQARTESLIISDVQKEDATFYSCLLKDSETMNNVTTQSIYLTVLYFPSAIYPICIPDGPFTVQEGGTVNMSCTTVNGNPTVTMHILTDSTIIVWTYSTVGIEQTRSSNLTVNSTNQGFSYYCKISSSSNRTFAGMERSCRMGPITITSNSSESPTQIITTLLQSTATETTLSPITDPSNTGLPIAIIAGAGGAGGLILLIVLTLTVLYVCKCCCFNDKPGRPSSLWLTDLPLDEPTQDPHTNHDIDHSEPKMSTSVYQNVPDMQENKVDPRMPPQSVPESPHLDPHDDEAVDFIPERKFSTHSENSEHSPKSPGVSSFKLTRSDDRITDKEDGEHLGAVEPDEGDAPMYGVVNKPNRVSKEIKKKPSEVASDVPDPWANVSLDQHENMDPPASTESEYAEVPSFSDDPGPRGKPTAMVKPVSHTPKPPVHPKPVTGRQSSRRTNTNQAPRSVAKKPVKKFTPSQRNPLGVEVGNRDEAPLPTPVLPGVPPQPPPPASPLVDHEENASVEEYGVEGGHEVSSETHVPHEAPSDTQLPHEAHAAEDRDVTYAELEFQSTTSDAMPEPQEEQTLYASITSK